MRLAGWVKRLNREGRVLAHLSNGRAGYGVYSKPDRRCRPLAIAAASDVSHAISEGVLEQIDQKFWTLSAEGKSMVQRATSPQQAFIAQHGGLTQKQVMDQNGLRDVTARANSSGPLARYLVSNKGAQPLLEQVHAIAAETLIQDYERAGLRERVTSSWSVEPRSNTARAAFDRSEMSDHRLDAKSRFFNAMDAVGPALDRLLMNILIRETGMTIAEREIGWPTRTGASALKLALDRLAIHYRLKRAETLAV